MGMDFEIAASYYAKKGRQCRFFSCLLLGTRWRELDTKDRKARWFTVMKYLWSSHLSPCLGATASFNASLGIFPGDCPGLLDLKAVQGVIAVCDQWVWFSGTGGPCQGFLGWFSLSEE